MRARTAWWVGLGLGLVGCSANHGLDAAYEDARYDLGVQDIGIDAPSLDTGFDAGFLDVPLAPVDVVVPMDTLDATADASGWIPYGSGPCNARVRPEPLQPAYHVDMDAGPITWWTDPPTSGPHYPIWAHWGAFPHIPPGYWVHNLEHGGVVFLYPCPIGTCDGMLNELEALTETFPADPECVPSEASPARVRTVVTDYTPLQAPVMAVAWGWMYAADCVDSGTLTTFYLEHHGMGPEDFCEDGFYP